MHELDSFPLSVRRVIGDEKYRVLPNGVVVLPRVHYFPGAISPAVGFRRLVSWAHIYWVRRSGEKARLVFGEKQLIWALCPMEKIPGFYLGILLDEMD